ncbi:hypothetical protein [Methylobacterium sp. BTF04]|uniref:hypothetical protein n=1 Tax=Methylobacterium sp. BTF04 TaxID=2708300 RepID=UPI00195310CD|nr:hypothetical protein [Methylobacterium sp. BTF04]
MRGKGGDALARHLLKPENDSVDVIPPRGLGSADLVNQLRELVAISSGGRTDRGIYHVHCDPDLAIADNAGARARWWSLFEREFSLTAQPMCGAVHVKHSRMHEHRVYSLVRPSGAVVDLGWDFLRRERCSRIVEFEFGIPILTPSKHARSIVKALREAGREDVASWMEAAGTTEIARPVAALSPVERLVQERTGIVLDDVRRAALEAWSASVDGPGFEAALATRGLALRAGRSGPVIVDAAGEPHLVTRLLGAAARRFEGERIPAATVRGRLAELTLKEMEHGRAGRDPEAARRAGEAAPRDRGGPGAAGERDRDERVRRLGRGAVGLDGGGVGHGARRPGAALGRLRALPPARGAALRRRLTYLHAGMLGCDAAVERARHAAERLDAEIDHENRRAWALWGLTDIWGLPLT